MNVHDGNTINNNKQNCNKLDDQFYGEVSTYKVAKVFLVIYRES